MYEPLASVQARRDERGFTLIEVLIVSTVCLVGLMAVISTFDSSRRLVSAAERTEVVSQRAERELERVLALPYARVGLQGSTPPGPPASPSDPDHPSAPVVMGGVLAHSSSWTDDASRMSGTVTRYVTQYNDPALTATTVDGKRVTIAVTTTNRNRPATTTTIIRDEGGTP